MPDDSLTAHPAPASRRAAPLRIGEFSVRPASNEIVGRAGLRRLRPRLMLVLLRLAAEPGVVVPRQTLLDDDGAFVDQVRDAVAAVFTAFSASAAA